MMPREVFNDDGAHAVASGLFMEEVQSERIEKLKAQCESLSEETLCLGDVSGLFPVAAAVKVALDSIVIEVERQKELDANDAEEFVVVKNSSIDDERQRKSALLDYLECCANEDCDKDYHELFDLSVEAAEESPAVAVPEDIAGRGDDAASYFRFDAAPRVEITYKSDSETLGRKEFDWDARSSEQPLSHDDTDKDDEKGIHRREGFRVGAAVAALAAKEWSNHLERLLEEKLTKQYAAHATSRKERLETYRASVAAFHARTVQLLKDFLSVMHFTMLSFINQREEMLSTISFEAESVTNCHKCKATFAFFKRKNFCRRCSRCFCNQCSRHVGKLPYESRKAERSLAAESTSTRDVAPAKSEHMDRAVRLCDDCYNVCHQAQTQEFDSIVEAQFFRDGEQGMPKEAPLKDGLIRYFVFDDNNLAQLVTCAATPVASYWGWKLVEGAADVALHGWSIVTSVADQFRQNQATATTVASFAQPI